ncbi:Protein BZZ1 [Exophiala xenobiotica]
MAQVATVSFGAELKDGYKSVDNWVSLGINWLTEIQEFYQERSAIEKEYSQKLTALAKKYYDKKSKRSSNLSVGDNPALTPGSLEAASLTTWTTQLSTLEARANEHSKLAQDLISQVATPLEYNARKLEELRKSHAEYNNKLVKERDSSYGELKKLKTKYDTVCQEVENKRRKTESGFDKAKAQNAYNQQLAEMHNVKNTYLIGINVTNKLKECYYHEYIPELLDSLQDLNETRVAKLNSLWLLAVSLETNTLKRSIDHLSRLSSEIPRNNPSLDSNMFVRHNAVQWQEPSDMVFEPSPVWLDADNMMTDETSKIFLRNILQKSKPLVSQLKSESAQKRRDLENVRKARQNIREGKDKRDEVLCVVSQFNVQEELHAIDRKRLTAEVETSTITSVVGDLSKYGKSHTFKSETFKIPTNCDLCGDRIWGLSAKGFICTDCGFTCHSKCHMKVPADCPGEQTKEEKKKLKTERQAAALVAAEAPASNGVSSHPPLTRQDTMSSLSSGYAASATRSVSGTIPRSTGEEISSPLTTITSNSVSTSGPRRNRVVAPPPSTYVSGAAESGANGTGQKRGKMLYAYEARDQGEVSLPEGAEFKIIEPDDGGWTKIHAGLGKEGLVPTAYLEELATPAGTPATERPPSLYSNSSASLASSSMAGAGKKKQGPVVAPKRGAKKVKYVEALYAYTAQSEAEFDMAEGEKFILISMGTGDGWADVEKNGETRSVPANYIQEV